MSAPAAAPLVRMRHGSGTVRHTVIVETEAQHAQRLASVARAAVGLGPRSGADRYNVRDRRDVVIRAANLGHRGIEYRVAVENAWGATVGIQWPFVTFDEDEARQAARDAWTSLRRLADRMPEEWRRP